MKYLSALKGLVTPAPYNAPGFTLLNTEKYTDTEIYIPPKTYLHLTLKRYDIYVAHEEGLVCHIIVGLQHVECGDMLVSGQTLLGAVTSSRTLQLSGADRPLEVAPK